MVAAAASSNKKQQPAAGQDNSSSSRNANLYELFDDDGGGWGVEAVTPATAQKAAARAPPKAPAKPKQPASSSQAGEARAELMFNCMLALFPWWPLCHDSRQRLLSTSMLMSTYFMPPHVSVWWDHAGPKPRKAATPFADLRSDEGKLGLTLLQKMLLDEEQQQQGAPAGMVGWKLAPHLLCVAATAAFLACSVAPDTEQRMSNPVCVPVSPMYHRWPPSQKQAQHG